jgi:hypothetical protein
MPISPLPRLRKQLLSTREFFMCVYIRICNYHFMCICQNRIYIRICNYHFMCICQIGWLSVISPQHMKRRSMLEQVCLYVRMHVCAYLLCLPLSVTQTHKYALNYGYIYVYICVCMYVHIHTHTCMHTHGESCLHCMRIAQFTRYVCGLDGPRIPY